ncbi:AraC family transcriptional regulator, partial [Blautia sp.]
MLNYISENYKRPISLDEIAGVAYLQTGYFCRFFKKKMGVTFLEYQNEYRLSFIYK